MRRDIAGKHTEAQQAIAPNLAKERQDVGAVRGELVDSHSIKTILDFCAIQSVCVCVCARARAYGCEFRCVTLTHLKGTHTLRY